MNATRKGVMLVICAPSGTGKSTLVKRLASQYPDFAYSVSWTTRAPRGAEKDGVDYHFATREEFDRKIAEGFFAEWADVHGNRYGTPRQAVLDTLEAGRDMLFDIDVQGAAQLRESMDRGVYVFLLPPSRRELERRLRERGTDAEEVIGKRLQNAREELESAGSFDYWIVNDDLDAAYSALRAVYVSSTLRPSVRTGLVDGLIQGWDD